jgi:hypothetical protein
VTKPLATGKAMVTSEIVPVGHSTPLRWGVKLYAAAANSQTIYVVEPGKTLDDGFPVVAGETLDVRVDDLAKVYVTAAVGGASAGEAQELRYLAW